VREEILIMAKATKVTQEVQENPIMGDVVEAEVVTSSSPALPSGTVSTEPSGAVLTSGALGGTVPPSLVSVSTPVSQVVDPSHAVSILKGKVSLLHKVVYDVGHFSTLAFDDAETLLADIAYMVKFIRRRSGRL
jgi:hypothetical protein